ATLNDEFHVQLRSVIQSCDVQVWVVDFHTSWRLNVASRDCARAFLAQVHNYWLIRVRRKHQALNIQDDFGNVFLHTIDGGELVENTFDLDGSYCCTRDGRQQGTTHGVTDGVAETWLKWFEDEPGAGGIDELLGNLWTLWNKHGNSSCRRRLFGADRG